MQLSPIDVNVDLDINLTNSVMDSIHVNQYENNVRQIRCHIKNDGVDYSLPFDADVRIRILKPSGKGVYVSLSDYGGTISSDRTMISFMITNDITKVYGRHSVDFEITFSDNTVETTERLYSNVFYINVHKSAIQDDTIKDSDNYKFVDEMYIKSKEYTNEKISELKGNVSDDYNTLEKLESKIKENYNLIIQSDETIITNADIDSMFI